MRFTNIPDYIEYSGFEMIAQMNKHTSCSVVFTIDPEMADRFLAASEQRTIVQVYSDSDCKLMNGFVSEVSIEYASTLVAAKVTITSDSLLLQESGSERVFQNPNKSFSDVLKAFPRVKLGQCDFLDDTIGEILCQHKQDDFSFLLFLAGKCECGLWVNEDSHVYFGHLDVSCTISDDEKQYEKSVIRKRVSSSKYGRLLEIDTMEHIPCGSLLTYNQTRYIVCYVQACEKYGEMFYHYECFTYPQYLTFEAEGQIYARAKVTANKDPEKMGRLQVDFIDYKEESSEKTWIPYLTQFTGKNSGGIVFMPDTGDEVIVCVSGDQVYALNSLRVNALPDNCCDVNSKYLAIDAALICLNDKEITLRIGDKTSETLSEESAKIKHGKVSITLDTSAVTSVADEASMAVKTSGISSDIGQSSLIITSQKTELSSRGKAKLHLDSNGSTKLAGNNIKISGDKIDLSTAAGSI